MEIKPNQINYEKVTRVVDLIIPSQNAKLTPPVGPILGQFRIKVKNFCDDFNKSTLKFSYGLPLKVYVYVYKDLSFNYTIKTPPITFLIKNLQKQSPSVFLLNLYKILLIKKKDLPFLSLHAILKSILSTYISMKIKI